MTSAQHHGAVFDDHSSAEVAVEELRRMGLGDDQLGVAVHVPDGYVFERAPETEIIHGVEKGIVFGAPIGAAAGMALLALALPGVGTLGVGGILAAGGVTGALAGGFLGGFLGLNSEEEVLEEEWDWERLPLHSGQMLVVVSGHDHPTEVAAILSRHGGEIVSKPDRVT